MADDEAEVEDTGADPEPEAEVSEGADPSTDETTDVTDTGTDPVEAQPADEPEEYRKLLEKVGGDKGKVASEYWQAKNALKAAANEKRTLEARLKELEGRTRQPEKPLAPPEPPQPHPDIKKLETRITAFSQRSAEIESEQRQILFDLSNATVEKKVRESQLKSGEEYLSPETKTEIKAELRYWESEEKRLLAEFKHGDMTKADLQDRLERLEQEKAFASKHLEGAKARQEQAERERESFFEEFPNDIDGHIKSICDELKIAGDDTPEGKVIRESLWEDAYAHMINVLSPYYGQGIPADQVDFQGVIKAFIERKLKVHDQISRTAVAKLSQAKLKVSKPAGSAPVRPQAPQNPAQPYDRESDPRLVEARRRLAERGL